MTHPWRYAEGPGWRHGRKPAAPGGLGPGARAAWETWVGSWWAWFYEPADVPGLRLVAVTLDRVNRGEVDVAKLTPLLDRYGITPKGRQDLRWAPMREVADPGQPPPADLAKARASRRARLQ